MSKKMNELVKELLFDGVLEPIKNYWKYGALRSSEAKNIGRDLKVIFDEYCFNSIEIIRSEGIPVHFGWSSNLNRMIISSLLVNKAIALQDIYITPFIISLLQGDGKNIKHFYRLLEENIFSNKLLIKCLRNNLVYYVPHFHIIGDYLKILGVEGISKGDYNTLKMVLSISLDETGVRAVITSLVYGIKVFTDNEILVEETLQSIEQLDQSLGDNPSKGVITVEYRKIFGSILKSISENSGVILDLSDMIARIDKIDKTDYNTLIKIREEINVEKFREELLSFNPTEREEYLKRLIKYTEAKTELMLETPKMLKLFLAIMGINVTSIFYNINPALPYFITALATLASAEKFKKLAQSVAEIAKINFEKFRSSRNDITFQLAKIISTFRPSPSIKEIAKIIASELT